MYWISTEEELSMVTSVTTWSFCLISTTVAPLKPSDSLLVVAAQFVKVTVPKSAMETGEPFTPKSSTIHSAFWPPSVVDESGALNVFETDLPVDSLVRVTVPSEDELATMETAITSPADTAKSLKSCA